MKFVNLLVILLVLGFGVYKIGLHQKKENQHLAMHYIAFKEKGFCTAEAVSPSVLLTAEHCYQKDTVLYVDPKNKAEAYTGVARILKITKVITDGQDHILLVVPNAHFTNYVPLSTNARVPAQQEHFYYFGNPEGVVNQYREGCIAGELNLLTDIQQPLEVKEHTAYIATTHGAPGDSGSSVYSSVDGKLIGIMSLGSEGEMGIFPMEFTKAQLKEIEKK